MRYVHGASAAEQTRLESQNRLLGGAAFLPPLRRGMRVLDVGCGVGAVAREVAPKVAHVAAVDRSPKQIAAARRAARGIPNIEFHVGRAEALEFPDGSFDLVCCRFLLEHVREPLRVIREMARVTRPGGMVIACECVVGCCATTRPPIPHAARGLGALYELQRRCGGDPNIGERLEDLFREAGLCGVKAKTLRSRIDAPEGVREYAVGGAQMLKAARTAILEARLLSPRALDEALAEWDRFAGADGAVAFFTTRRASGCRASSFA